MRDSVDYSITSYGDLRVQIIDNSAYEVLEKETSDLFNFFFLTDFEKENGGFYFTTINPETGEIGNPDDMPCFLEHWKVSEDGRFFYMGRIWAYRNYKNQTPLNELLSSKEQSVIFERVDCVVDIENIFEVATLNGFHPTHTDEYSIYEIFETIKNKEEYRTYNLFELTEEAVFRYFGREMVTMTNNN